MTELPAGPFRTIVADPPWPMPWSTPATRINGRGERHINHAATREMPYSTLLVDEIAALPVGPIADPASHLYLWAPDRFVINGSAVLVARAWGFEPLRFIVWAKPGFGLGYFPRPQHELLLVCRRGRLPFNLKNAGSIQKWKQPYHRSAGGVGRQHSAKPEAAQDLIERASPGPYLELFARRERPGWTVWGNEA